MSTKFWTEKYQTILPGKIEDGEPWASPDSQRVVYEKNYDNETTDDTRESFSHRLNKLPSGMSYNDPATKFVYGFGGDTDVTNNVTPMSLKHGYEYDAMAPTDDQYGGEHIEVFYGEAVGDDGRVGFVERNNYLDRA